MNVAHHKPDNREEKSKVDDLVDGDHQNLAECGFNELLETFSWIGRQHINITINAGRNLEWFGHLWGTSNPFGPQINWNVSILIEMRNEQDGDTE